MSRHSGSADALTRPRRMRSSDTTCQTPWNSLTSCLHEGRGCNGGSAGMSLWAVGGPMLQMMIVPQADTKNKNTKMIQIISTPTNDHWNFCCVTGGERSGAKKCTICTEEVIDEGRWIESVTVGKFFARRQRGEGIICFNCKKERSAIFPSSSCLGDEQQSRGVR